MKIYSIYDKKAMTYSPVMSFENEVLAVRAFEQFVLSGNNTVSQYPSDFVLCYLGEMDDNTGALTCDAMPRQVEEAMSVIVTSMNALKAQGASSTSECDVQSKGTISPCQESECDVK